MKKMVKASMNTASSAVKANSVTDTNSARPVTDRLVDMIEDNIVDAENCLRELLFYLSEDEVKQFVNDYDYFPEYED